MVIESDVNCLHLPLPHRSICFDLAEFQILLLSYPKVDIHKSGKWRCKAIMINILVHQLTILR